MNTEGRGLFSRHYASIRLEELRTTTKKIRITGLRDENRNRDIQNTKCLC